MYRHYDKNCLEHPRWEIKTKPETKSQICGILIFVSPSKERIIPLSKIVRLAWLEWHNWYKLEIGGWKIVSKKLWSCTKQV